jgi:short-subunit dehydrogenase
MAKAAPLAKDEGRKPVCVITGGSEGIGRHLANEFAQAGMALLLIARTESKLEEAATELQRDYAANVYIAKIDLADSDPVERVQFALDLYGLYADFLVNNAAIGIGGPFTGQDTQNLNQLVALNVHALTALTRRFLPDMVARGRGGVLNVASLGGLMPGPYQAAYYASKAYVLSLTEALAFEYAGSGVRISVALPGPVTTRFHERMGVADAYYLHLPGTLGPERTAALIYNAFAARKRVIVPGVLPSFNAFWLRVIPHFILVPIMGWLLKRRYRD